MRSHSRIASLLKKQAKRSHYSINKKTDAKEELLSPLLNHTIDIEESNILQPLPVQAPSKPFLLYEIEDCIKILENASKKNLNDNIKQQTTHYYYFISICTFCLLLSWGPAALSCGIMLFLMKKISQQINSNLSKLFEKYYMLKHEINQLEKNSTHITAHNESDRLWDEMQAEYKKWFTPNEDGDSCDLWLDPSSNNTVYLWDKFPGFKKYEECYFEKFNQTHPIFGCNELANKLCGLSQKFDIESKIDEDFEGAIWDKENQITLTEFDIDYLRRRGNGDPLSTAVFIVASFAALAFCFFIIYKCHQFKQAQPNKLKDCHDLHRCLNPKHVNRIINLTERLGYQNIKEMTLDTLLTHLKSDAEEINGETIPKKQNK